MKKFSYENWYDGIITLKYAKSIFSKDSKPKLVSWNDFNQFDVNKIKKMQTKLFHEIVEFQLNKFKTHFKKIHASSRIKDKLLEMEMQECKDILYFPIPIVKRRDKIDFVFSKSPYKQEIVSKHWKVLFDLDDLLEIKSYYKNTILGGNDCEYDFIQSPNDKFKDNTKLLPQVYASVVFEYFQWLEKNYNSPDIRDIEEKNISIEVENFKSVNLFPHIFKNKNCYDFFSELKKVLVKGDTKIADFSFIFHKMNKDGFILNIKHKVFISFLNKEYDSQITDVKFPYKNQITHLKVYEGLKSNYKNL